MKQSQISLIVIGFILVALMATNPSTAEHKEAVKETLIRILENKEEYSEMQHNAREMIVSRFDQKIMWESILQEYRNFEAKM